MLGNKMDGSGLSDILLEAGLITSGSLSGVKSGTNYSRSIQCHKVLVEVPRETPIRSVPESARRSSTISIAATVF